MEKAERILCVIGKNMNGGVENIIFSYYRNLDKSKYRFDFVYEEGSAFDIPQDIVESGAGIYKVPSLRHFSKYFNEVKKIITDGNYRIVHANNNTLSAPALYAAKKCGVPIRICHNHTTSDKSEHIRGAVKKALRVFCRRFSNQWCACSEVAGRWMFGDNAFDCGKVKVINNGIELSKFAFNNGYRSEIRGEFGLGDKTVIGHIGRFVSVKNHRFILEVFEKYHAKNSQSVLIFVGDGKLREDISECADLLGLSESVIFTGNRDDTYKLYSAFDCFILPSFYEGFPIVSVEAAASGLPVLLSDRISRECKLSDRMSFLPIENADSWVDALTEIDRPDRTDGEICVSEDYDIGVCARRLEKFYSECLGNI